VLARDPVHACAPALRATTPFLARDTANTSAPVPRTLQLMLARPFQARAVCCSPVAASAPRAHPFMYKRPLHAHSRSSLRALPFMRARSFRVRIGFLSPVQRARPMLPTRPHSPAFAFSQTDFFLAEPKAQSKSLVCFSPFFLFFQLLTLYSDEDKPCRRPREIHALL
jgi:hypothetical protein